MDVLDSNPQKENDTDIEKSEDFKNMESAVNEAIILYNTIANKKREIEAKNYNNVKLLDDVKQILIKKNKILLSELDQIFCSMKSKTSIILPKKYSCSLEINEIMYKISYNYCETDSFISFGRKNEIPMEDDLLFDMFANSYRYATAEIGRNSDLFSSILSNFDRIKTELCRNFSEDIISSVKNRLNETENILKIEVNKESALLNAINKADCKKK